MKQMNKALLTGLLLSGTAIQAQWVPQASNVTVELRGLSVVSPKVVWASGQRGTVLHTVDGGKTWIADTVPGAGKLDLRSIDAVSDRVAFAMSIADSGRIFRTTDGGKRWDSQLIGMKKGSFFDAIRFWDAKHGIAFSDPVDGKFVVITTSDGGNTWTEVPPEKLPAALANEGGFAASGSVLAVHGKQHAWIATGGASAARVYHTADRGKTWEVFDTPIRAGAAPAGAFSVAFRDAKNGIVVGGDYTKKDLGGRNVALTSDGGRTWTLADSASAPNAFLSAVTFVPKTKGRVIVATGLAGTHLSRDGGKTWSMADTVAMNAVLFANEKVGYAVGPKGRVMKGELPLHH